ncbi:MAG: GNAT family N-acetyltransferase, partial [Phycisphaerae bacterium]
MPRTEQVQLEEKELPVASSIREYTPEDQDDVAALFDRTFGTWSCRRWLQRWKWQYRDSPRPPDVESHIQVVEAEGRVVGHLGAFPLILRVGDEHFPVLSAGDFVVAEGHRLAAFGLLKNLVSQGRVVIATGSGPEGRRM